MSAEDNLPDPDPGHTDCAVVIREVWSMLDGEVTDDEADRLRRHLDHCPACLRHYGVEERIKHLLAAKLSGEKAPAYLVERVRLQISRTTIIRYS
ncbi:MAG: mycothiol system anti-sigma-R factor [Mycobacterium sp.]